MKQDIQDKIQSYVGKTDLTKEQKDHTWDKIWFIEKIFKDIEDVFISEKLDSGGKRENYTDLYVFTSKKVCIAKDFLKTDEYISTSLKDEINWWKLNPATSEKGEIFPHKRIIIKLKTIHGFKIELKATEKNCAALWEIFKTYINPISISKVTAS